MGPRSTDLDDRSNPPVAGRAAPPAARTQVRTSASDVSTRPLDPTSSGSLRHIQRKNARTKTRRMISRSRSCLPARPNSPDTRPLTRPRPRPLTSRARAPIIHQLSRSHGRSAPRWTASSSASSPCPATRSSRWDHRDQHAGAAVPAPHGDSCGPTPTDPESVGIREGTDERACLAEWQSRPRPNTTTTVILTPEQPLERPQSDMVGRPRQRPSRSDKCVGCSRLRAAGVRALDRSSW
jgi:hypothetical protein